MSNLNHNSEITTEDRFIGSLQGLAIGDAVGTTLEFSRPGSFKPVTDMTGGGPFHLQPSQWTDDTSMALCLTESLIERQGFDPEDQMLRYLLDIESRGSLLSVKQFQKPFDFNLKIAVDSAGAYEERRIDLVETFNYLIGLRVKHMNFELEKGFVWITGKLPTGKNTLILWRDVEQVDDEALNQRCNKLAINPADSEFEIVYINGDHNIPSVFTHTEAEGGLTQTLKIHTIEQEFLSRMFTVEGV
ncbi:MAG: ADP-ribosylglycohydrolase family protein [SAR324 cluster bacterium]|nr:ADP-ribosylglycohydrolase family protein [SAR324 cluster bacterium]